VSHWDIEWVVRSVGGFTPSFVLSDDRPTVVLAAASRPPP